MTTIPLQTLADAPRPLIEGIARVLRIEGATAWLEPEQTTACHGCAAAASCGGESGGFGSVASRLAGRRFTLDNSGGLRVGERIVVGVNHGALIKAALTAYALPLATTLSAGGLAEWAAAGDLVAMASMAAGLGLGILAARIGARHLAGRGELAPHFLRRADAGPVAASCGELSPGSPT
jgi:sigma-E factor negative regulatory protein RseC